MKQTIEIPEGFELKKVSDTEYKIVEKKLELPSTWEEFCEKHPIQEKEYYFDSTCSIVSVSSCDRNEYQDKNILPNKEYAEAILALCQLIQLRDCYRQGWKPDWNEYSMKYCITFVDDFLGCLDTYSGSDIFAFQSKEIRAKFLNNFSDLLKKVAYLYNN